MLNEILDDWWEASAEKGRGVFNLPFEIRVVTSYKDFRMRRRERER